LAGIAALVIDKKHRENLNIPRSCIYPFNTVLFFGEMYNIGIGRIFDIPEKIFGREKKLICREHFFLSLPERPQRGGLFFLLPGTGPANLSRHKPGVFISSAVTFSAV
jgi:hypothetical protein